MKQSFFARHAFTIILVTVFGMPIVFGAARFALKTNTNDVKQWLPESYAETQEYHRFRRHFEGEEFILVSWDGCTLEDGRLPLLAAKLVPPPDQRLPEDGPPLFKKVITGPGVVETLTSEPTSLSYEQAVERMSGTLIGHDLETTCAVLTLSDAGKVSLHKTIAKIRDTAANECAVPLDSLHMGGPPVDNVAIDVAGQESLYRLAGLAGIIGLVISWWCLRTWRLITMVFATAIYSAAASLAVVYWTGDSLNAILLTMPPLVYVAATSGAIHLSNYYRDTAKELGVEGAPGRALRHALLPISLATITTSVGLLSLCYSELVPIQMFGLFSAIGVGISMLLLTVWMPAALQLFPLPDSALRAADAEGPGTFDPMSSDRWPAIGRWILRRHWLVNAACLLLLGLCTWGVTKVQTSVQLMRLFDSKARILADYKWLEENLGELIPMEVVIKIDEAQSKLTFLEQMELVSRIQHRVDAIDVVGSSLSCVTFAPDIPISEKPKSRRGFREITERNVRNKRLDEHRDDFLAGDYLRQAN
ncbi:MAG: MMPL family transporter, partial [Planctomycetes bacterium]|nr:MMPL family transporter [Planctomycetota bacterium]